VQQVSRPVELSFFCKFRDVSDIVKFAPELCLKHVDVWDLADQFVVEGFKFPFVVGGEGPQLGAPAQRLVEWELDALHFLDLRCDSFDIHVLVSSSTCAFA
jgi:hypothetical protein